MLITTAIIQQHFILCKECLSSTELVGEAQDGALFGHTPGSRPLSSHQEHGAAVALSTSFRARQPFLMTIYLHRRGEIASWQLCAHQMLIFYFNFFLA